MIGETCHLKEVFVMNFKDKIRALGGPGGDHEFSKILVVLNDSIRLFCLKELQFLDEV
jgi:hypothetical protein